MDSAELRDKVMETIKTIYDPEIQVNIYDLGLIYRIDIMPISETVMLQIEIAAGKVSHLQLVDPVSMKVIKVVDDYFIFPAKHFISDVPTRERAVKTIEEELKERLAEFEKEGKILEAERLKRRTRYDVAMIREVGFCQVIENYSRHLS